MNVVGLDNSLMVSQEVILGTGLLDETPKLVDDDNSLDENKKEVSDAILELLEEETSLESKVVERVEFLSEERLMYEAMSHEVKGLDYSKLEYGKIAQPLAIKWEYSDYKQDDKKKDIGIKYSSEETLSIDDVNKVIEEQALAHKLRIVTNLVSSTTRDMFKYYKLFNHALVKVKYELALS